MAKLKSLKDTVNVLTGAATKHNRALREIGELLKEFNDFLTEFDTSKKVFENIVKARVDISTLMYKIRARDKIFRQIKNKQLASLMLDLSNKLENVRVDIYSSPKGKLSLNEDLSNLNASLKTLLDAVSNIEFK